MKVFNSVAQLRLSHLTAGQLVETSGYYTPGDGGGAKYLIAGTQAVDNFGSHDLANTNVAILQNSGTILVEQFGAVGDSDGTTGNGTDNATFIQAAVDASEANAQGPGPVYFKLGTYRSTVPIVNDQGGVSFIGAGAGSRGQSARTTLFLDSAVASDYYIKLFDRTFAGGEQRIIDIAFKGTNRANNQGGILIAGRASRLFIERCDFGDHTGYAIGRDPTGDTAGAQLTYTQNNAIRDCQFTNVGGCYGLIFEPIAGNLYLAETLLTLDNVNLDQGLNPTDVKPYIWDFRATRQVNCGIMLVEGVGVVGVVAVMAFATNGTSQFDSVWSEWPVNPPTYGIIFIDDNATSKFRGNLDLTVKVKHWQGAGVMRFETDGITDAFDEATLLIEHWMNYNGSSVADVVSFQGDSGKLEIDRYQCKTPFIIPESHYGRLIIGQYGGDKANEMAVPQKSMSLLKWDASMGSLLDASTGYVTVGVSGHASESVEMDGNFLIHRFTGNPTSTPQVSFNFNLVPTEWQGAMITWVIRYRVIIDAADTGTIFRANYTDNLYFDSVSSNLVGGLVENSANYETAYVTARIGTHVNKFIFTRHTGTAPTVAPIVRIMSVQAWLGLPDGFNLAIPAAAASASFTRSDGAVGGAVSAGAGNQYVELNINGTTYKVLHDGII